MRVARSSPRRWEHWPRQQEHEEVRIERARRPPAVEVGAGVFSFGEDLSRSHLAYSSGRWGDVTAALLSDRNRAIESIDKEQDNDI